MASKKKSSRRLHQLVKSYIRARYYLLREREIGRDMYPQLEKAESDLFEYVSGERELVLAHHALGGRIAKIDRKYVRDNAR